MISPFVRRRRLADELIRLREEHGYSSAKLAVAIEVARQRISRLENGHVAPDLDEIMRILQLFDVDEGRWERIMTIAREAQERGWWEKFSAEMGTRQALYANLEAGASSIREYQMVFQPGLLQLSSYTEARARIDRADSAPGYQPTRALEGRAGRQRMVERPGGPTYTVVIDELAIRRHAVPPDVAASQLDHMAEAGATRETSSPSVCCRSTCRFETSPFRGRRSLSTVTPTQEIPTSSRSTRSPTTSCSPVRAMSADM